MCFVNLAELAFSLEIGIKGHFSHIEYYDLYDILY
jgi:hypothetical protein